MRKLFKIIEKIVWAFVIIAIIIVLVLVTLRINAALNVIWARVNPFMPYFYIIVAIFAVFNAIILVVQIYLERKTEEKIKYLQTIIEEQRAQQIVEEQKVSGKLDKIIHDIASISNADTTAIVDFLKTNLPNVVSILVDQQVRLQVSIEKQKLALEYDKKESELKCKLITVDAILERRERIQKINEAIQQRRTHPIGASIYRRDVIPKHDKYKL